MSFKRVVVTGLGALTPIGNTLSEYWNGLLTGVSGANPITHFDADKFKTRFACEVKNFNILNYIENKEAHKMDPCSHYALVASMEAMKDSGIDLQKINLERAGIILGTGVGGLTTTTNTLFEFIEGGRIPKFSPYFIPKVLADIMPGWISIYFGFKGPNYTTTSACASSANAIADAYYYIKMGKADVIISGGSEACIAEPVVAGFNAMHALSTRNDECQKASRPFDVKRDGFVIGEGAGILILEEYEHAKARGAKIYAEIGGIGLTADAFHITLPEPEGTGAANSMKLAIEEANLKLTDIDHINTHGTSTPAGDLAECKAIKLLFEEHTANIPINSIKSMTGHLLGAAAAVEGIATILSIKEGIIPPTINLDEKDPLIPDLNFVIKKPLQKVIQAAISNSFGFGGHNVSILYKKVD